MSCLFLLIKITMKIHNIAIIAHVDHGKTTLVDAMLKQTHTFRDNQKEMQESLILDSNDLEKEKGITILAKNTSVFYNGDKINIIDTPGHADFAGEVERTINMADGALLLVDSAEGPLPQTKFVLKKAIESHLKIILLINKIDKKDARPKEVLREVENLFLELAENDTLLDFTVLYGVGRDGKVFKTLPKNYNKSTTTGDLTPLFQVIIDEVPDGTAAKDKPFQMLISTLDYDPYIGRLCIGKVNQGELKKGQPISLVYKNKTLGSYKAQKLFTTRGLKRVETDKITAGDIVAIAGIPELNIGQTVTDINHQNSLPDIKVEEPTIKITIGPNTSPFAGKEGKFVTSRQIRTRLFKEKETNLGLKVDDNNNGLDFIVYGRGELHLAILIETMRREGFEMQVSRPQVIYKTINNVLSEPYEEVTIDVDKEFVGVVSEEMGKRYGTMLDMISNEHTSSVRIVYKISTNNLLGIRNSLLTKTKGTATLSAYSLGYKPKTNSIKSVRNGSLVAVKTGTAFTYGLVNAQQRGALFISPGEKVYEGMVVGIASKEQDIEVNVCKAKHLTNNRSVGEGVSIPLVPAIKPTLEQYIDLIALDELLEVTPMNLRLRKKYLSQTERRTHRRQENRKELKK